MAQRAGRGTTASLMALIVVAAVAGALLIARGFADSAPPGAPLPGETFDVPPESVTDPFDPPPDMRENSVAVPSVDIDAALVENDLDASGSLVIPEHVDQATFWTGSAPINATRGAMLVAGHVDDRSRGEGALFRLHDVQPGAAVFLDQAGLVTRWKVVRMETVSKQALPDDLFRGGTGARELYLVTCGGEVVRDASGRNSYSDNVIVAAVPY
ncbi:class F sortase [Rhodococcus sp. HNM0569]|uniref:class F sortase n=1 Tax=Rhodococcus sp. HNM0569 TaxID=2716340 RepID=UPI00146F92E1|nr:class F sortase [Rhodococcus sp. HNM0569]NLU85140.1 class F sortase [Rhodococcus sp. HNM0569]